MANDSQRLSDLIDLREKLLGWMDSAPVDRKAALVAQYRATITEIEELSPREQVGDGIDQIAARRAARRSGSSSGKGRAKLSS